MASGPRSDRLNTDLARLNDDQKRFVRSFKGPALVVAGPGTGKTRTMAVLLGSLLADGGARGGTPVRMKEILALTFSAKAATELRERVLSYSRADYDECWISTFHSFCARMLRERFHEVGVRHDFKLLTGFKETVLFELAIASLDPASFPVFGGVIDRRGFQLEVLTFIALLKSNLVDRGRLRAAIDGLAADSTGVARRLVELDRLYAAYEDARAGAGYLDFRDLISQTVALVADDGRRERLARRFRVIVVDEFQDTDPAQYHLLRRLAEPAGRPRLAVVGDPNQCIYRFRGADPTIMGSGRNSPFRAEYKAGAFVLGRNYRSAEPIVALARRLLARGGPTDGIDLTAESGRVGFTELFRCADEIAEARLIGRRIAALLLYGQGGRVFKAHEIAILVRNNAQLDLIVEALYGLGIPYAIAGDMRFFKTEAVTLLANLLQAITAPAGSQRETALGRVLVSPLLGLPIVTVQQQLSALAMTGRPVSAWLETLCHSAAPEDPDSDAAAESTWGEHIVLLRRVATTLADLRLRHDELPIDALLAGLFMALPSLATNVHALRFREMVGDFAEVYTRVCRRAPRVSDLMTRLEGLMTAYANSLASENDVAVPGVRLMTVHQSKGLEFPVVFVPGLVDGQFPVQLRENLLLGSEGMRALKRAIDGSGPGPFPFFDPYPATLDDQLDEERRLFFVAITRAEEGLVLSWSERFGAEAALPSPFLADLGMAEAADFVETRPLSIGEVRAAMATLPEEQRAALRPLATTLATATGEDADIVLTPRLGIGASDRVQLPAEFTFSASSLKDYLDCPRRFFFRHVLRVRDQREERNPGILTGKAVHAVLQHLHDPAGPWAAGNEPDGSQWPALWDQFGAPHLAPLPPLERRVRAAKAQGWLEDYRQAVYRHGQFPAGRTEGVEKRLRRSWRGFNLVGQVDRLVRADDGALWIIDYKTGKHRPSARVHDRAFPTDGPPLEIQLPLYLLLLHEQTTGPGLAAMTVALADGLYRRGTGGAKAGHLRSGALSFAAGPDWGAPVSADEMAAFAERMERVLREITETAVFACRPAEHAEAKSCRVRHLGRPRCEFVSFCQERLEELNILSADDVATLAAESSAPSVTDDGDSE